MAILHIFLIKNISKQSYVSKIEIFGNQVKGENKTHLNTFAVILYN